MGKVAREQLCPETAELRPFPYQLSAPSDDHRRPVPVKLLASNSRLNGMKRKKLLASNSTLISIETGADYAAGKGGSGA